MALILPRRIYFKKVGFEIFKYSMASSVVKTLSLSLNGIDLLPFTLFFVYLKQIKAKNMPEKTGIPCLS